MAWRMSSYRLLTGLLSPLVPLWLHWRRMHGKEDPQRLRERFGYPSQPRPPGTLLWMHAASVGEANSILPLIHKIRERLPEVKLLLTTGTVTSARLMQSRLPKDAIHQYVPVDTPRAVERFIRHWHPDVAFWVESEFWPNLVLTADDYECFMGIVNARMSERSLQSWRRRPELIKKMLGCFNLIFAQTGHDAGRLEALGARDVLCVGNIKYDAALLSCDEGELISLQSAVGSRPVWMAASTHPGEEALIAEAQRLIRLTRPNLLTVITPRHPGRGPEIAAELRKQWNVALRSRREPLTPETHIYIADTMGEMGLFYRLCETVFMGGSLVAHGGQNPLEPARLACAIVTGPHTHNFAEIYGEMEQIHGCLRATDARSLALQVDALLTDARGRSLMQTTVKKWVESKGGTVARLMEFIEPVLTPKRNAA